MKKYLTITILAAFIFAVIFTFADKGNPILKNNTVAYVKAANLTNNRTRINGSMMLSGYKESKTATENFTFSNAENLNNITANVSVGNIYLTTGNTKTIKVKMKNNILAKSKKDLKVILASIELKAVRQNGGITLKVVKKGTDIDLWSWLSQNLNSYNLSVRLSVTIPKNIKNYDLNVDTGNISAKSLKGNINAKIVTGNLSAKNMNFNNVCSLKTSTGNIRCSLAKKLSKNSKVTINANTGSVNINMNKHKVKYLKDKKSVVGRAISCNVDSSCKITAKVDTGDLNVSNSK